MKCRAVLLATPLLAFLAQGCQPAPIAESGGSSDAAAEPGWRWTDAQVFETVNAVRAGRDLNPTIWPGEARVAVLLSFDVDNETVTGLRYGDATVGSLSQGQYGARVALPRVVELLDRKGVPASFFVPAMSLILNPFQIDVIKAAGHHEFAIHGWIHELNTRLGAEGAVDAALLEELLGHLETYRALNGNGSGVSTTGL